MFSKLVTLGSIGCLVWSYFEPSLASKVFIISFTLYEGYIYLMSLTGQPRHLEAFTAPFYLNPEEVAVVKKYHLFFKFPMASSDFSAACSIIQLSSFIWVPWLLYQGLWPNAISIGANSFIAAYFATKLNPRMFLSRATGAMALVVQEELYTINSALEKLMGMSQQR